LFESPDPFSVLFRIMVTEGRGLQAEALRTIAESDAAPLVFHCTSGKDRTGLLSALIQLIAGVGIDEVLADFEHSAEALRASGQDLLARFPRLSELRPEQAERMRDADPAWVLGAIDEIGGLAQLDGWLDSIGVDAAVRAGVRRQLRPD
jgi:protein-tyrosine phosphatase